MLFQTNWLLDLDVSHLLVCRMSWMMFITPDTKVSFVLRPVLSFSIAMIAKTKKGLLNWDWFITVWLNISKNRIIEEDMPKRRRFKHTKWSKLKALTRVVYWSQLPKIGAIAASATVISMKWRVSAICDALLRNMRQTVCEKQAHIMKRVWASPKMSTTCNCGRSWKAERDVGGWSKGTLGESVHQEIQTPKSLLFCISFICVLLLLILQCLIHHPRYVRKISP